MAAPSAQSLQIDAIAAEKETIIASDGFHAAKVAWVLLNAQTPGFTNFQHMCGLEQIDFAQSS
jgi:hypothetical protein